MFAALRQLPPAIAGRRAASLLGSVRVVARAATPPAAGASFGGYRLPLPLVVGGPRFFSSSDAGAEAPGAGGEELPPPFKPVTFSPRFAHTTKPFFPVIMGNLRPPFKKKLRHKLGKGMGSGNKGMFMNHRQPKKKNSRTWEHGADPIFRRIPKWKGAHKHMTRKRLEVLNLSKLRYFIEKGRLDTRFPITQRHLYDCGCVTKVKKGVTIFNVNDYPFPYKIDIEVAGADQSSIDMIKAVGGSVTIVYMEPITLRAHVKPWKFEVLPRTARPTLRMVHTMEKFKAKGALVRYIKPLWLIEEERRLQTQLRELRGDDGHLVAERMARADERGVGEPQQRGPGA